MVATVAVATGCVSTTTPPSTVLAVGTLQHSNQYPSDKQYFNCQNGLSVTRQNLSPNEIKITVTGGYTGILQSVKIGKGERFSGNTGLFGYGGDWQQKGDVATFSYTGVHGNQASVTCQKNRQELIINS